jgi:hypothetical protein
MICDIANSTLKIEQLAQLFTNKIFSPTREEFGKHEWNKQMFKTLAEKEKSRKESRVYHCLLHGLPRGDFQ